jgi:hypothetical protein
MDSAWAEVFEVKCSALLFFFFWCSHKKCLAACYSAGRGVIIEFNVRCLALSPQSLSFMDSQRSRSLIPIDAFLRSKDKSCRQFYDCRAHGE